MDKYRKKPLVIEAKQINNDTIEEVAEWCKGVLLGNNRIMIFTIEGDLVAGDGDYIIKDINGEFFPCNPDVFDVSYEPME